MRKILVLMMVAMLGSSVVLAEEAQPTKLAESLKVNYYQFPDHFTTNLRSGNKLIQATIAIDTEYEDAVIWRVIKHRLAIANEIVMLLSNQTEADLRSPAAKAKLQDDIRDAVNAVLDSKYRFGGIDHAYITSLTIQ
jgi:flagellar basal body-associated protein FliL